MDLKLHGKKALITGSSKGIGEAIAKTLAREKAIVVIHGRDEILTEKVAHAITAQGGRAYAVTGDLTCDEDVTETCREGRTSGGFHRHSSEQCRGLRWFNRELDRHSTRLLDGCL